MTSNVQHVKLETLHLVQALQATMNVHRCPVSAQFPECSHIKQRLMQYRSHIYVQHSSGYVTQYVGLACNISSEFVFHTGANPDQKLRGWSCTFCANGEANVTFTCHCADDCLSYSHIQLVKILIAVQVVMSMSDECALPLVLRHEAVRHHALKGTGLVSSCAQEALLAASRTCRSPPIGQDCQQPAHQ